VVLEPLRMMAMANVVSNGLQNHPAAPSGPRDRVLHSGDHG